MFDFLATLLPFLGVLFFLVLVHELGHFVTAKMAGVTVQEFGFGYPPRLFAIRFKGTDYSLNILPLGGFVKLLGEENPEEAGSLAGKPAHTRLIILAAGSFMNAVLPIALLTISVLLTREVLVEPVTIGVVSPGSPAASAGLEPGDVIVKVNDRPVENRRDLSYNLQLNMGSEIALQYDRNGRQATAYVLPRWSPPAGQGPTGITFQEPVRIEAVMPNSPAFAAGLQAGDRLHTVNGQRVNILSEVRGLVEQSLGKEMTLEVQRGGATRSITLTPRAEPPEGEGPMGVLISAPGRSVREVSYSPIEALALGTRRSFDMLSLFKNGIFSAIVSRSEGPAVTGPVGIAQATGQVARAGVLPLLEWMALLSMNLAILNILPIPMLDGGRILFVGIEWARRGRRISPERESLVHLMGFVVLMGLIAIVTFNDVARLIRGETLFP